MGTAHSEVPPDRPEHVASTTMRNSFGVLDAVAAFGVVYAVMRVVSATKRRFRPISWHSWVSGLVVHNGLRGSNVSMCGLVCRPSCRGAACSV